MPAKKKPAQEERKEAQGLLKSLAKYAARVGAERLNFKRYMVKEHSGQYYREVTIINLDPKTGEMIVKGDTERYGPTDDERKAVKEEALATVFPHSVPIDIRAAQDQAKKIGGIVYLLPNRERTKILMLQQRFTDPAGKKVFVPWSFWSDEGWLDQEPDGDLPFWKPIKDREKARIMIHEGAKAAMAADAIAIDKKSKHPWAAELALYEHWGMMGGAMAPHRADFKELEDSKPEEVVYVCDNDKPGTAALKVVSKHYMGTLKGIFFDPRWKGAWDLAEEMPAKLFVKTDDGGEKWIGQSLRSLMKPATHATRIVPAEGRGRPSFALNEKFVDEWVHAVTPPVYMHIDRPNDMMSEKEFNSYIRPYSDAEDTARLIRTTDSGKSRMIKYDPTVGSGLYRGEEEERYFNTFVPSSIKAVKGDPGPWLDYMEHLLPVDQDREEVIRWVATLVVRTEIKMRYGVLLQSVTQGVGKGTLGEKILIPLVGPMNTSEPSENTLTNSQFNDWVAHKRLAVCHEIYAGHSSKAYNTLKSYLSEDIIEVNKKFTPPYSLRNWIHVLACSNSTRALQLTMDDRRWLAPKVREEKKPPEYWTKLNKWLLDFDGLGIIRWWLEEWLEKNKAVERSDEAPWTVNKREVIEDGYSPGMQLVSTFLREVQTRMPDEKVIIVDTALVAAIKEVIYEGRNAEYLEKPLTLRKIATTLGYHIGETPIPFAIKWGQGATAKARPIFSSEADLGRTVEELVKEGRRPLEVSKLMKDWGIAGAM